MAESTGRRAFNPFPGLRPFRSDEDYLFFGREVQVAELLQRLQRLRFVAVVGTSGSGKSSLVRCGLLSELQGGALLEAGAHWEVAVMQPGGDPLRNLARALCEADLYDAENPEALPNVLATLMRSRLGLVEAARQSDLGPRQNLLVVVDQFEEIFRFHETGRKGDEQAPEFIKLLLAAARQSDLPIYIVITMRSDFLGDCSQFAGLAEIVNDGEYLIPRLSREECRAVIEGPAGVAGGAISRRLVQQLLNDIGDDSDQLPILQHALMRTWDHHFGDARQPGGTPEVDLSDYAAIGAMAEALSRHADEVFEGLASDRHREVARRLFKALTELGSDNRGIRRPARLDRLREICDGSDDELRAVIEAFRGPGVTFLMPGPETDLTDRTVIDLSHESLMRTWIRLRRWVEEESQSARIYRRLAETTALWKEDKAGLYHDPDLQIALSWRDEMRPNAGWAEQYGGRFEEVMTFLEESRVAAKAEEIERETARQRELAQARRLAEVEAHRAREQQQRLDEQARAAARLKLLVVLTSLVALVAVIASIVAVVLGRRAEASAAAAEAARASALESAGKLTTALSLADFDSAYRQLEDGNAGLGLMFAARSMRTDPSFWPPGFLAISTLTDRAFHLEKPVRMAMANPIDEWNLNAGREVLWTTDTESRGQLWNARTGAAIGPIANGASLRQVAFTSDGETLVTLLDDGDRLQGWEARSGKASPREIKAPGGTRFLSFHLNPNPVPELAGLVLTRSDKNMVRVWNLETGEAQTPPRGAAQNIQFSPDGRMYLGTLSKRLVVWSTADGNPLLPPLEPDAPLDYVRFSPDSRWVVALSSEGRTATWFPVAEAVAETAPQPVPVACEFEPKFALFDPSLNEVMIGGQREAEETGEDAGDELRADIYRLTDPARKVTLTVPGITRPQDQVQLPLDRSDFARGQSIDPSLWLVGAIVEDGRTLRIWDLYTGAQLTEVTAGAQRFTEWSFSPDGGRFASIANNHEVRLWDTFSGESIGAAMEHQGVVVSALFSDDGEKLFTFNRFDNLTRTWSARTGREILEPISLSLGYLNSVTAGASPEVVIAHSSVSVTRNGVTRKESSDLTLLPTRPEAGVTRTLDGGEPMTYAGISPNGKWIVGLELHESRAHARVWEAVSGKLVHKLPHPSRLTHGDFSPDGNLLATSCNDGAARIWDLESGSLHTVLQAGRAVRIVHFTPTGREVVVYQFGGWVTTFDVATGQPLFDAIHHGDYNHPAVAVEPVDGESFLLVTNDEMMHVFNVQTGEAKFPSVDLGQTGSAGIYTSDGKHVVAAVFMGELKVWDAESGQEVATFPDEAEVWTSLAAHPRNPHVIGIAGGSHYSLESGFVMLWDWMAGRMLTPKPMVAPGQVRIVAFSPDGALVAAATANQHLNIWESAKGRLLVQKRNHHDGNITALQFSPDGKSLLTASADGTIKILELPPTGVAAPAWLPDLVEAVVGQRLSESNRPEPVEQRSLAQLRRTLETADTEHPFGRWGRWFVNEDPARPVSHTTDATVAEHARQVSERAREADVGRAILLNPSDGVLHARMALARLRDKGERNLSEPATRHWNHSARWHSERALALSPEVAEVWALRAAMFDSLGDSARAAEAVARAVELGTDEPNTWYLRAFELAGRAEPEEAYQAFAKAVNLAASSDGNAVLLGTLGRLKEMEDPGARGLAFLAWQLLADRSEADGRAEMEARWLSRLATERGPRHAEVWRLRSEVLFRPADTDESLAAFRRAAGLPDDRELSQSQRGQWLRPRLGHLRNAEGAAAAREHLLTRGFQPRDDRAAARHVDLSAVYNLPFFVDPLEGHNEYSNDGPLDLDRSWLGIPEGLNEFAGVVFDARGLVQLRGSDLPPAVRDLYPEKVEAIPVRTGGDWIHFLHGELFGPARSTSFKVGEYVLHFADGQSHVLPLQHSVDVIDRGHRFTETERSDLAWTSSGGLDRLFVSSWENPRPEVEIESIEFRSTMAGPAPLLLGITLEPSRSSEELAALEPLHLAQEALTKARRVQGAGRLTNDYLKQLLAEPAARAGADELEVALLRAESFLHLKDHAAALTALKPVLEQEGPASYPGWLLKGKIHAALGTADEALPAFERASALAAENRLAAIAPVREAAAFLEAIEGSEKARAYQLKRSIPPRDPAAPKALIDLSAHYNASLLEPWYERRSQPKSEAGLAEFDPGVRTLGSVAFDVRGLIQLVGSNSQFAIDYPREVTGIPIGQRADLLHFLHATHGRNVTTGAPIAHYRLHYANGETRELDLRFQVDAEDFVLNIDDRLLCRDVWRARGVTQFHGDLGLFSSTRSNPLPEVEIVRLDFVSAMTPCEPFLLAVSAEVFQPPETLDGENPERLAEIALSRVSGRRAPDPRTLAHTEALCRAVMENPASSARALRQCAEVSMRLSRYDHALRAADQALMKDTHDWPSRSLRAVALGRLNRTEEAREAARAVDSTLTLWRLEDERTGELWPPEEVVPLISRDAEWQVLDAGLDPGPGWRDPGYADDYWNTARPPLGYGGSRIETALSFGPDPSFKYPFLLMRHSFEAKDPGSLEKLKLRLRVDDGAVVYLNGTEVARDNLRPNAPLEQHTRRIVGGNLENLFFNYEISPALLVPGNNCIAVEVHQCNNSSSDLILELALEGKRKTAGPLP